jgi:ACDE family multidrug resistance protein
MSAEGHPVSPFRQPKAVWAVAFACVVSFMGIGLVDPILPALSKQLRASPSSVELLFTSYLVVTAVAMLFTGWVSSRFGGKRTLVSGLVLIVAFSALAGSSGTINEIIGYRAGWGLGNALFIATSLAVIVGAASGGLAGAVILYETALGVGIAMGPLVGGELGGISWRGPFYGVSVLMGIAMAATLLFLDETPRAARPTSILEPLNALRHRGLATMSIAAVCYNWGFFTLLAFTPFPMHLGIHQLGYVFTGWGALVAVFAVFVAPRAQARFGTARSLYVSLALLAVDLVVVAAFTSSRTVLVVAVVLSGAIIGLNNPLTTQAVMLISPVDKAVASASYGFVRFIGGGLAPYVASRMAVDISIHAPFYVGAGTVVAAIVVLASGHTLLTQAEQITDTELTVDSGGRASGSALTSRSPTIVAAIDATPRGADVMLAAVEFAKLLDLPVEVVHVIETDIVDQLAIEFEPAPEALALIAENVEGLRAAGISASGHVLTVISGHGGAGRRIAEFANQRDPAMIIIGTPRDGEIARVFDGALSSELIRHARAAIHVIASSTQQQLTSTVRSAT